jgi:hypothetical protein
MMGWVADKVDRFRGRGAHAATVPPMDGTLRPNTRLEEAAVVARIAAPDNLVMFRGQVLFSSGCDIHILDPATGAVTDWRRCAAEVTALAVQDDTLAIALADGSLVLAGDSDRSVTSPGPCVTAMAPGGAGRIVVCVGSSRNSAGEWKRDLLQAGATGSVWSLRVADGGTERLAQGLAWPCGAAMTSGRQLVVVEAWRHRVMQPGAAPLFTDLPGYPGRLSPAPGGWWLTVFAPRNQLIELVLRERDYRERMMREVEPDHWIAPTLSPAVNFNEPMQGGAIRTHGIVKPWAPTRSYGLLVRLDGRFQPIASYHSRADGRFHGVTSALHLGDRVLVTSRGGNAVLALTEVQP